MSGMMARMSSREDWRRVADAIARRRAERDWTQMDIAQRGPLSLDRVQSLEGAKRLSYRAATIAAIERALEWEYGSIAAILAGDGPIETNRPDAGVRTEYRLGMEQVREMARQLPREVIRQLYKESEAVPDDSPNAPETSKESPRYSDTGLQRLWDIEELSEHERLAAITLIKALRDTATQAREHGEGAHRASGLGPTENAL